MQFNIFEDEALESLLLRLCHKKRHDSFSEFVQDLDDRLRDGAPIGGRLSSKLSNFNIYKSSISSMRKVKALWLLQQDLKIEALDLLKFALMTSEVKFSPNHEAVYRNGIAYPKALLRKNRTPICPECLKQNEYIRQDWQFIPYAVCHIHHCGLVHRCPDCHSVLNYQKSESITFCHCGYDLRKYIPLKANKSEQALTNWLVNSEPEAFSLPSDMSISARYGFLHWYIKRYGKEGDISADEFAAFCAGFPDNLFQELQERIEQAEYIRVNRWQHVSFKTVFDDLLLDCRQLPSRHISKNIVLNAVLSFFIEQVKIFSNVKEANFTSVLLTPFEASALLSCSHEEVYRL